jgi:hypothetical protein
VITPGPSEAKKRRMTPGPVFFGLTWRYVSTLKLKMSILE